MTNAVKTDFTLFEYVSYDQDINDMIMINLGHTLLLSLPKNSPMRPSISGGGLQDKYEFVNLHFHWGDDPDKGGSEHLIGSKRYPAEMHLVHYNTKYNSFSEATHHPDGLAVLDVMLDVPNNEHNISEHDTFGVILGEIEAIAEAGKEVLLPRPLRLIDLLPSNLDSFFRYDDGSLTTPKFAEIVIWTVFDTVITVTEGQVSLFPCLKRMFVHEI